MNLDDKSKIPVLTYLFRKIENSLTGKPSLLVLDEAWLCLGHEVFRGKIEEWLRVLRKKNCSVILATQSIVDLERSGIAEILKESCPTVVFLPNPRAASSADFYRGMGLNDVQISLIKDATPKRQYYYHSPDGNRVFELGLGEVGLSFVGASNVDQISRIKKLEKKHKAEWPKYWLKERKISDEKINSFSRNFD